MVSAIGKAARARFPRLSPVQYVRSQPARGAITSCDSARRPRCARREGAIIVETCAAVRALRTLDGAQIDVGNRAIALDEGALDELGVGDGSKHGSPERAGDERGDGADELADDGLACGVGRLDAEDDFFGATASEARCLGEELGVDPATVGELGLEVNGAFAAAQAGA